MNSAVKLLYGVVVAMFLLTACTAETTVEQHIANAKQYAEKREYNAALISLKNALLKKPQDAEIRLLLGQMYLNTSNPSGAEKELKKAGELGIPAYRYAASLSQAYLEQGNITDILGLDINDAMSDQDRSVLYASRGYALVALGDLERATEAFQEALQSDPQSVYARVGKAGLHALQKRNDLAYAQLDEVLKIDPEYAPAWSYKGSLERFEGKLEQAIASYTKAIEANKANDRNRIKRAMLLVQTGALEQAQSDLTYLKKRYDNSPDVNYIQGLLHFKQRKFRDAQIALEHVLGVTDQHIQARFLLGQVHLFQGNLSVAQSIISNLVAEQPRLYEAKKLLAMIYLRQNQVDTAIELLREVTAVDPDDLFALNMLADALLLKGKDAEALEHLKHVVELKPGSAEYRMRMGAGLLQLGDKDAGLAELNKAKQIDSGLLTPDLVLIRAHLRDGNLDEALKAANAYAKEEPAASLPQNFLGIVYTARKELEQAEAAFEAARQISKGDVFANQNLSSLALLKKQPEKAKEYLLEILQKRPAHLGTLLKLASIEGLLNHPEARIERLTEALRKHPTSVAPRLELARGYLQEKNLDAVDRELNSIDSQHRNDPEVLLLSGQMYLLSGDGFKAQQAFQQLLALRPKSAEVNYLLASAYALLDKQQEYRTYLQKALQISPKHPAANRALIRLLLMADENLAQARERLDRLRASGAEDAGYLQLEALYFEKAGDTEKALDFHRRRVEQEGSDQSLIELSRFQWRTGDPAMAAATLAAWNRDHPGRLAVMLELANAYLGTGEQEKAVGEYKRILELSDDNLIALNNLAWHLMESAPAQALEYAERAYKVAPSTPTVMDTLAMVLLNQGGYERALRLIDQALQMEPGNPSYLFHKAMMLEKSNRIFDTKSVLINLRESKLSFPEKEQADKMLKRLEAK